MGVSGCGKTTIAELLSRELGWDYRDGDEFHPPANVKKMQSGTPLTDDDRWPWLEAIAAWIAELRRSNRHGVLACSALKRQYRDLLRAGHADVRFAYLKGDEKLIARRIAARHEHFMPPALLRSQFDALQEPGPDEDPITVAIDARPHEIAARILSTLNA